jgi:hypothetical protein
MTVDSLLWPEEVYHNLMDKIMNTEMNGKVHPPLGANTKQVDGNHYKDKAIQPWDYISSNNMGFLEGCIIKYVSRYQEKNGVRDLEKAKHFLEKLIEVRSEGIGGA